MTNTLKNASLLNVSTNVVLYTVPSATTAIVLGLSLVNKNSTAIKASVTFTDTSASKTINLLYNVNIPANTTLELFAGQKIVLETGDILKCTSDTANSLDVFSSFTEIN